MKKKSGLYAALLLLAAAAAGAALRAAQLQIVFDADGLPTAGHPLTWVLCIYCILVVLAAGFYCLRLPARASARAVLRADLPATVLSAAGGVLLLFACLLEAAEILLTLRGSGQQMLSALSLLLCVAGMLCGLLILASAAARQKGSRPVIWLYLVPFLYIMVRLVLDFKSWSSDPVILDYCFCLFAQICVMGGAYRIGGYCFDQGRRRLTAFWSMTGVFFCAVSLPGGSAAELLFYGACLVWMFSCAWMVLRPGRDPVPAAEEETAA